MNAVEQLEELMREGWNINIECKAKGRVYEMTYEAHGGWVVSEDASTDEHVEAFYKQIHAVGDTFEEVVANLKAGATQSQGEQLELFQEV